MLVATEAYAEAASAVPNVVAGVIVDPVGDGKRDTVEEHITAKVLVCLLGHDHNTVIGRLPVG